MSETVIKVSSQEGKQLGELILIDNKLIRGSKLIRKILGPHDSTRLILKIINGYIQQDREFGSVLLGNQRYCYCTLAYEESDKS